MNSEQYFNSTSFESTNALSDTECIHIIKSRNSNLIAHLAANPNLDHFFQEHLCYYHDPIVREVLASRNDISRYGIGDILVADKELSVRLALARNPYVAEYILMTLAGCLEREIKDAVAANPRATDEIKKKCELHLKINIIKKKNSSEDEDASGK